MTLNSINLNNFVKNCDIRHGGKIVEVSFIEKCFSLRRKYRLTKYVKDQLEQLNWANPSSKQAIEFADQYRNKVFSKTDKDFNAIYIDRYVTAYTGSPFKLKISEKRALKYLDIGLDGKLAKKYPGFVDFLKQSDLITKMRHFGHKVHEIDEQPAIYYEGNLTRWTDIKALLFDQNQKDLSLPYGYRYIDRTVDQDDNELPFGIVKQNLIKWKRLHPSFMDHKMPGKFFVEVVSDSKNFHGHAWIRIIDNKTNVISVGFFRKCHFFRSLATYKGKILQLDPHEFAKTNKTITRIEISEKEYHKIIEKIETDQETGNLGFNYYKRNCAKYTCEVLEVIGIKVDNDEYPSQSVMRWVLESLQISKISKVAVSVLFVFVQAIRTLISPIYNIILWTQGINHNDGEYQKFLQEKGIVERNLYPFRIFSTESFRWSSTFKLRQWQHWVAIRRKNNLNKAHKDYLNEKITKNEYGQAKENAKYEKPPSLKTRKLFAATQK